MSAPACDGGVGDGGVDDLGIVDEGLADLRRGKLRRFAVHVFDGDGIGDGAARVGDGLRGLFAHELPRHGGDGRDEQDDDQQIDEIELSEQTTFFVDDLHDNTSKLHCDVDLTNQIEYNIAYYRSGYKKNFVGVL